MIKPAPAPTASSSADMEADLSAREVEILRSAYRVMARVGGHRLSVQDIADEASSSKGLVLYHFKTKNAVLLAAMRWALLRTAERIRDRLSEAGSGVTAHEALTALVDAIFVSPQANRDFQLVYLDLIEHAAREESFSQLPAMTREIMEGLYAELITDGVERGIFAVDDVTRAALTVRAIIDGVFLQWLQRDEWEADHDTYKLLCRDALSVQLTNGAVSPASA